MRLGEVILTKFRHLTMNIKVRWSCMKCRWRWLKCRWSEVRCRWTGLKCRSKKVRCRWSRVSWLLLRSKPDLLGHPVSEKMNAFGSMYLLEDTYRVSFGKRQMYSIQFSPIFPTLSTFFPYISLLLLHKSWHRNATRINNGEYSRLSNNRTCMFCRLSRANKNESFHSHLEH